MVIWCHHNNAIDFHAVIDNRIKAKMFQFRRYT